MLDIGAAPGAGPLDVRPGREASPGRQPSTSLPHTVCEPP